jgi:hypothetical protein
MIVPNSDDSRTAVFDVLRQTVKSISFLADPTLPRSGSDTARFRRRVSSSRD